MDAISLFNLTTLNNLDGYFMSIYKKYKQCRYPVVPIIKCISGVLLSVTNNTNLFHSRNTFSSPFHPHLCVLVELIYDNCYSLSVKSTSRAQFKCKFISVSFYSLIKDKFIYFQSFLFSTLHNRYILCAIPQAFQQLCKLKNGILI